MVAVLWRSHVACCSNIVLWFRSIGVWVVDMNQGRLILMRNLILMFGLSVSIGAVIIGVDWKLAVDKLWLVWSNGQRMLGLGTDIWSIIFDLLASMLILLFLIFMAANWIAKRRSLGG